MPKRINVLHQPQQPPSLGRGGYREGSGRKPMDPRLRKDAISIKLPRWLIDWMDDQDQNRAVLIEGAMVKQYKIKAPG